MPAYPGGPPVTGGGGGPTIGSTGSSTTQLPGNAGKVQGLGANYKRLKVAGSQMSAGQAHVANIIIWIGSRHGASSLALVSSMYCAIWESKLGEDVNWNGVTTSSCSMGFGGALAGCGDVFSKFGSPGSDAVTQAQAERYFMGGDGFNAGGAIALSKSVSNPIEIAVKVNVPSIWPDNAYAKESGYIGDTAAIAEAQAIVQAAGGGSLTGAGGGGGGGGTKTIVEPYFFEVHNKETYWHAMRRLADEVNWELFWDGNRLYYDSEQALIKQKPAAMFHRDSPQVVDWDYDWDTRAIVTEMHLTLLCDMFEFLPGEVLELHGFGPASSGSTATPDKLPGRWLIQSFQRNKGDATTVFTLVQPDLPKMEPAPKIKQVTTGGGAAGSGGSLALAGTTRAKIVEVARKAIAIQAADSNRYHYLAARPFPMSSAGGAPTPPGVGLFWSRPLYIDCSAFTILCYKEAGGPDPSGNGFNGQGNSDEIAVHGTGVSLSQAQPGDCVCYPGHVAVYLGGGQIANMGSEGEPVAESVQAPHGGSISTIRSFLPNPTPGSSASVTGFQGQGNNPSRQSSPPYRGDPNAGNRGGGGVPPGWKPVRTR